MWCSAISRWKMSHHFEFSSNTGWMDFHWRPNKSHYSVVGSEDKGQIVVKNAKSIVYAVVQNQCGRTVDSGRWIRGNRKWESNQPQGGGGGRRWTERLPNQSVFAVTLARSTRDPQTFAAKHPMHRWHNGQSSETFIGRRWQCTIDQRDGISGEIISGQSGGDWTRGIRRWIMSFVSFRQASTSSGRRHSVVTISRVPQILFGRNRRESFAAVATGDE